MTGLGHVEQVKGEAASEAGESGVSTARENTAGSGTAGSGGAAPAVGGPGAYFGHGGAAVRVLPHGRGRTVAVIGVGYVGLPTAATLAHLGHRVTCGDADAAKIERLQRGQISIVEEHLEELVQEGQTAGRLRFVTGATAAVADAEFVFLCVPTPQGDDGSADLSFVVTVEDSGDSQEVNVPVTLTIGDDRGTASVKALIFH